MNATDYLQKIYTKKQKEQSIIHPHTVSNFIQTLLFFSFTKMRSYHEYYLVTSYKIVLIFQANLFLDSFFYFCHDLLSAHHSYHLLI